MPAASSQDPLVRTLAAAYAALWVWAAIAPTDRPTWLLENLLVFAGVGALVATRRRFRFSRLSYTSILLFLALHAVGAHYTYSATPVGDLAREALGLARNPYDRFVHLAFGLLLAGPVRELVLRRLHVHGVAGYALPVALLLASSGLYEMIESWAARIFDPEVGVAFVGAQGDVWDSQKDMGLAFGGAVLAMALAWLARRATGREPFLPQPRRSAGIPG